MNVYIYICLFIYISSVVLVKDSACSMKEGWQGMCGNMWGAEWRGINEIFIHMYRRLHGPIYSLYRLVEQLCSNFRGGEGATL